MDSPLPLNSENTKETNEAETSVSHRRSPLDQEHHSSKYSCCSCHHRATIVRLTCEGDINDPNFPRRLKKLVSRLKFILSNEKRPLQVTKVEPWNSVRVTFNLPQDAAQRLRQLAVDGDDNLRNLGILSVQIEGQQVISLRLTNQNSGTTSNNNELCNIDQIIDRPDGERSSSNSITAASTSKNHILEPNRSVHETSSKYLYEQQQQQINGGLIGDESSDSSHSSEKLLTQQSYKSTNSNHPYGAPPPPPPTLQPPPQYAGAANSQQVYLSSIAPPRAANSLLLQCNQQQQHQQPNHPPLQQQQQAPNGQAVKANQPTTSSITSSSSSSSFDSAKDSNSSLLRGGGGGDSGSVSNSTMIHSQMCVQPKFTDSNIQVNQTTVATGKAVFNGPRTMLVASNQQPPPPPSQMIITSQKSVPLVSIFQTQQQSIIKTTADNNHLSVSTIATTEQKSSSFVNCNSTSSSSIHSGVPRRETSDRESTPVLANPASLNSGDLLGTSADAVDDEELLVSVGSNSLDINNLNELNAFTLSSVLNEIESTSQTSGGGGQTSADSATSESVTTTKAVLTESREEFASPNVIAPQTTQPLPFFIAQQQQTKSDGQLPVTTAGTVLNQSHQHKQQQPTSVPVQSSTLYPFTSMQHASMFNAKQQQAMSPRHVILPVRQLPVRASASSPQPPPPRSLPPSSVSSPTGNEPPRRPMYRPLGGQIVRQPTPPTSATSLQNTSQILIRPYQQSSGQQQSGQPQTNTVALSSPLLVNLLKHQQQQQQPQQQQQFVAGNQQIQFLRPSGSHGDGTQMMMMVQVSQAPGGGTTAQLINPSMVPGAIASQVDQQSSTSQSSDSSSSAPATATPASKPKKVRKPRKKNADNSSKKSETVPIGIQVNTTPITSGAAITSIPISLAATRIQSTSPQVSTIFTFPTSSIAQMKLQSSTTSPLTGQTAEQLFNKKSRVQPVVMIAASSGSLLNSVDSPETTNSAAVATSLVQSSTGRFYLTSIANCTAATSTTTTGVQLSGNRKQIFLATKSNSFPVSSALSSGGIVARIPGNSPSASSSPASLISSPVKLSTTQPNTATTTSLQTSMSIIVSNNSISMSPIRENSNKSGSRSSLSSATGFNTNPVSFTTTTKADLSTLSKSLLQSPSTPVPSSPAKSANNSGSPLTTTTATSHLLIKGSSSTTSIPIKNFQPISSNTNSLLLNKLNQTAAATTSPKVVTTTNVTQFQTLLPATNPAFQKTDEETTKPETGVKNLEKVSNLVQTDSNLTKYESLESLLSSSDSKGSSSGASVPQSKFTPKLSLAEMLSDSAAKEEPALVKPEVKIEDSETEKSTESSQQKSADDLQAKSNRSYDSFSYYLSNHSYSQALPDHILEDDEDDGDSGDDDFALYPKTSHFLSGSIGSIGARKDPPAISTTATAATTDSATIATSSHLPKPFVKSNSLESIRNPKAAAATPMSDSKSFDSLLKTPTTTATQNASALHLLMNGDTPAESNESNDSSKSFPPTNNSCPLSSQLLAKQFQSPNTLVASKSYPSSTTTQLVNSFSVANSVAKLPLASVDDLKLKYSTPEVITNDSKHHRLATPKTPVAKPRKVSTPAIPSTPKSAAVANKSRRKTIASVSTKSQTMADSMFPAPASKPSSTDQQQQQQQFHSLLSPSKISNISTLETNSTGDQPDTAGNTRPVLITFKQPAQQQQSPVVNTTNSMQSMSSQQATLLENATTTTTANTIAAATPNSATPKVLKVLLPGNIQGLSGNKLLAISGANTTTTTGQNAGQLLTQSLASNMTDGSGSSQSVTPVLGHYFVASPGGQSFSQLLVVKSVMVNSSSGESTAIVSSPATTSQVKYISTPNKLTPSVTPTTKPILIPMASSQEKPVIPTSLPEVAPPTTTTEANEPNVIDIDSPVIVDRKISVSSTASDSTQASLELPPLPHTSNSQSSQSTIESGHSSDATTDTEPTPIAEVLECHEEKPEVQQPIAPAETKEEQPSKPEVPTIHEAQESPEVIEIQAGNSAPESSQARKSTSLDSTEDSHQSTAESVKSDSSVELVSNCVETIPIATASKEENESANAEQQAVLMPNEAKIASQRIINTGSNVALLKTTEASTKEKEQPTAQLVIPNSRSGSPIRRTIYGARSIAKPIVVNQATINQMQSSSPVEITSSIFANKTSGASITATKTLPTILRQSKRKTEQLFQVPTSQVSLTGGEFQLKLQPGIGFPPADYSESSELLELKTGDLTKSKSSASTDEENNSDVTSGTSESIPKPRKRARKSKVTTIEPPVNDCDLTRPILISDSESVGNEMESSGGGVELKTEETQTTTSPTLRVLRNSNPASSPSATTTTTLAAKNISKRSQRNNRSMLAQGSLPVVVTATSPTESKPSDKLRKAREQPNVAARQTRSNRARGKKVDDTEMIITDNAVDDDTIELTESPDTIEPTLPATIGSESVLVRPTQPPTTMLLSPMPIMTYGVTGEPQPRTVSLLDGAANNNNSNSSTASSSSSNSLLLKRPRKSISSSNKPSLRSSTTVVTETLSLPMTPTKRRRIAKEMTK